MPVRLMAYIPDKQIMRGIEHVMKRCGELYHTQAGPEVTTVHGYRVDDVVSQLIADLNQLCFLDLLKIIWGVDPG